MDKGWQPNVRVPPLQTIDSQLSLEERAPGYNSGRINSTQMSIYGDLYQNTHSSSNIFPTGRVRAHTQTTYSLATPVSSIIQQNQISTIIGEQNRSRSSSWPNKPPTTLNSSTGNSNTVQRTRSTTTGNARVKKNSEPTTPRKKRKRLNPQRRSFYKALHNDFPIIAEALREARQGNYVIDSFKKRNIYFTFIEARPPQDPSNLNVRRYNDVIFVWDPNDNSWLQIPGNGKPLEQNEDFPPFILPNNFNSPPREPPSNQLPSFQLSSISNSNSSNYYSESGSLYTFEGPFISDSSQSEDEDFLNQNERNLNDFLPMNIINDVL